MSEAAPSASKPPSIPALAYGAPRMGSGKLGPRVDSLDLLRGIAILGIFLMNTQSQMLWWQAYYNPNLTVNDIPGDYLKAVDVDATGANQVSAFTQYLVSIFGPHLNAAAYIFTHLVADMKFITIFSFMFGAGIMLQGERVQSRGMSPWFVHYKRMAVLLLIALFHAYVIWYGDILTTYTMAGILLFPFTRIRPSILICIGVLFVSMSMFFNFAEYSEVHYSDRILVDNVNAVPAGGAQEAEGTDYSSIWPLQKLRSITEEISKHFTTTDSMGKEVNLSEPNAFQGEREDTVMKTPGEMNPKNANEVPYKTVKAAVYWKDEIKYRTLCSMISQTSYFWKDEFWRCGGCMLIGMALLKFRFFHGEWSKGAYTAIAALCIPTGMGVSGLGIIFNYYIIHWNTDLLNKFGIAFNYIGSFIQAFGYMSVGVLVAIRVAKPITAATSALSAGFTRALTWAVKPIRAVGKMALTNYLFQNIVGTTLAYAHRWGPGPNDRLGLAWYGRMERYQLLYIVPFVWGAQLILSTVWMRYFRQGPVEWAWHKLVYLGTAFPLRSGEDMPSVNAPTGSSGPKEPALA